MKTLKIKIESTEHADLVAALEDVLKFVRAGQTRMNDKNGFAEVFFEIADSTCARNLVEKKSTRKGKRNA